MECFYKSFFKQVLNKKFQKVFSEFDVRKPAARTVQQGADDYSKWQCEDRGREVQEQGVYGDPSITELPVKTAQPGENVFSKD